MASAVRFSDSITQKNPVRQQCGPVFAELVNEYTTAKTTSMSDLSMSNLLYKMGRVILPELGNLPATRIDHTRLDQYVAMRAATVKNTTIHRELSDIRAVLNWSARRGLISANPMAGFEMPKRDDAIILPLSHGEIEAIIAHSPEHLKRAMLLSFFCGMRPGAVELLSIRYNQVNWSEGTIMIISAQKGGVDRREVHIHNNLPLRQWFELDGADPEQYIITWQGKPVSSLKRSWATAKKAAGVGGRKIPPYSLRKSFVTTLLHLGVDPKTIADIAGHDVHTMLKHYAHSSSAISISAISQLPDMLHPVGAKKLADA